ncbi:MAG: hypothetical protein L0Y67_05225 [Gammaproteobacteria bacterium]|nr:hypothetical protein [Gammaproteobacteria bacterium]
MNAVNLHRTFNPATLLWQTRGRYWDYEFVAIPDAPCLGSWWDVFNQIFGGSPDPRKGVVHRYGELPGPQPRPFVAVAFSDAVLRDEHGRPICHYLVWFPETEAGPAFERLRTELPENWPAQILNTMRPYFESSDAFGLDEGKLQDMVKNGVKLGDYLIARVQRHGMQELQGFGGRTDREWKRVEITSPIGPTKRRVKYAAALAVAVVGLALIAISHRLEEPLLNNNKGSIAVMPFEYDLTNQQLASFNVTGLPDVISNLKADKVLDVRSYNKVVEYRGKKIARPELAGKLGVRYITTGTLYVKNDYVLATVRVTDTRRQKPGHTARTTKHRVQLQTGWQGALATQISMATKQTLNEYLKMP